MKRTVMPAGGTPPHENGRKCAWSAVRGPILRGNQAREGWANSSEWRKGENDPISGETARFSDWAKSAESAEKEDQSVFSKLAPDPLAGGGSDDPKRKRRERTRASHNLHEFHAPVHAIIGSLSLRTAETAGHARRGHPIPRRWRDVCMVCHAGAIFFRKPTQAANRLERWLRMEALCVGVWMQRRFPPSRQTNGLLRCSGTAGP